MLSRITIICRSSEYEGIGCTGDAWVNPDSGVMYQFASTKPGDL